MWHSKSVIWRDIFDLFNCELGLNFESVAKFWISCKKHAYIIVVCAELMEEFSVYFLEHYQMHMEKWKGLLHS